MTDFKQPSIKDREDFYYFNEDSLRIMREGYIANYYDDLSLVRTDSIARAYELVSTAEGILGFKLPMLRLGLERGWTSPSSPIWSNFGTERGLPISCNGSYMDDTMDSIQYKNAEIGMMTKEGAGTSLYMGALRPSGASISWGGKSDGPVHFARNIQENMRVTSQAGVRRGNCAIWLDVEHGDIEDWLLIKSTTGGVHHKIQHLPFGVVIGDEWMKEMLAEERGGYKRKIMARIINKKRETGFPYIMFRDNANKQAPEILKKLGLKIWASNLCTEIMLPSAGDLSFVCCLLSVNLLHFDEWKDTTFVREMVYFLDAVLTEYINKIEQANDRRLLNDAKRFAERFRALGLGTLGYHSYLQQNMIPFESEEARYINMSIHEHIQKEAYIASKQMFESFGGPEELAETGRRHLTLMAIAPTRSSSLILGQVSKGIEPYESNYFEDDNQKTVFTFRNPWLKNLLESKGKDTPDVWRSILRNNGSVQHLDFLSDRERNVFKTFSEISTDEIIQQAADRQKYIDQGQSLNFKIDPEESTSVLFNYIKDSWEKGLKSLYYWEGDSNVAQALVRKNENCTACEA